MLISSIGTDQESRQTNSTRNLKSSSMVYISTSVHVKICSTTLNHLWQLICSWSLLQFPPTAVNSLTCSERADHQALLAVVIQNTTLVYPSLQWYNNECSILDEPNTLVTLRLAHNILHSTNYIASFPGHLPLRSLDCIHDLEPPREAGEGLV